MATITERGAGQWRVQIRKVGLKPENRTFETEKEAKQWADDVEKGMEQDTHKSYLKSKHTLMRDLIKLYREKKLPAIRGKGTSPALNAIEAHLGDYAVFYCTSQLIREFKESRLRTLSESTVVKDLNTLKRLFDFAKTQDIELPKNPCAKDEVERPQVDDERDRRLEPGEGGLLIAEATDRVALLICFLLETATRLGEALNVHWDEIHGDVMHVKGRQYTVKNVISGQEKKRRKTKNNTRIHGVPLSPTALAVLDDLRTLTPKIKEEDRIFHWWKAADSFDKTWGRLCERAGIEDLRAHDLRHEATSRLFEYDIFETSEIMAITGHKSIASLQRYTHLRKGRIAKKLALVHPQNISVSRARNS